MCDPVVTPILAAVSLGTSIYGGVQQANAQRSAANAIAQQNAADIAAQNQGFTQRMEATQAQTQAQQQAFQQTIANRAQIADTMRQQQQGAFQANQSVLGAENTQQEALRAVGDQAAQNLLSQTSAPQLAQSQSDYQTQAANMLGNANVPALTAQGPSSGVNDPATNAALARRTAEAAANIRQYGATAAKVGSYNAPLNLIGNAITNTQTGIMPAAAASQLLQSGSNLRLAPSQLLWTQAGQYGNAADLAAQSSGQNALQLASLKYNNATQLADLQQSDTERAAQNAANQAAANAAYQQQMGQVISGIGNIGSYATGRYGTLPGFLDKYPNTTTPPLPAGTANLPAFA